MGAGMMFEIFYILGGITNLVGLILYKVNEGEINVGDVICVIFLSAFSFFIWPLLIFGWLVFSNVGEKVLWRRK